MSFDTCCALYTRSRPEISSPHTSWITHTLTERVHVWLLVFSRVHLKETDADMWGLLSLSCQGCLLALQQYCHHVTHKNASIPSYSLSPARSLSLSLSLFPLHTHVQHVAGFRWSSRSLLSSNVHFYARQGRTEMQHYSSAKLFNDLCHPSFTVKLCRSRYSWR